MQQVPHISEPILIEEADRRVLTQVWQDFFIDLNRRASTRVATKTASYTMVDERLILADATSGPITITLPSPSNNMGVRIVKKVDNANNVTVDTVGSETIDGASSVTLSSQWAFVAVMTDGTNYFVVGE